jgi:hypothetical protein
MATAWQSNKEPGYPHLEDFKAILIPLQHLLKTLDPEPMRPVDELRAVLREIKDDNEHEDGMNVNEALDMDETFHHLTRATESN